MELSVTDQKAKQIMKAQGIEDEDMTNAMLLQIAMHKEALKGNVGAYRALAEQIDKVNDLIEIAPKIIIGERDNEV